MIRHRRFKRGKRQIEKGPKPLKAIETYAAIAADIVTALAGAGAFLIYLWTSHGHYVEKRDPKFTDNWINFAEGCIDCPVDANDEIIKLNIEAKDGKIQGEIYIDDPFGEDTGVPVEKKTAKQLQAEIMKSYTNWFMVEGDLTLQHGTIWFFDFREGKKVYFGKANISLDDSVLTMDTKIRAFDTIPKHAVFSPAIEDNSNDKEKSKKSQAK